MFKRKALHLLDRSCRTRILTRCFSSFNLARYRNREIHRYYFELSNQEFEKHVAFLASSPVFCLQEFKKWLEQELKQIPDCRTVNYFNSKELKLRNTYKLHENKVRLSLRIVDVFNEDELNNPDAFQFLTKSLMRTRISRTALCTKREALDVLSFYKGTKAIQEKVFEWMAKGLPVPRTQEEYLLRLLPPDVDLADVGAYRMRPGNWRPPPLKEEYEARVKELQKKVEVASTFNSSKALPPGTWPLFNFNYPDFWDPMIFHKQIQKKEGTLEWKRARHMTR